MNKINWRAIIWPAFVIAAVAIGACGKKSAASMGPATGTVTVGGKKYIDSANMDLAVSPAQDFYEYANGAWLKATPIPPSESGWGSFNELLDFNQKALKEVLETAASAPSAAGTPSQKVGDFYASGMDSIAVEKAGLDPIRPALGRIAAVRNIRGLQDEIAQEQVEGYDPLFSFTCAPDDKNSSAWVAFFAQGGMHLPDRDYYLKEDERFKRIRVAYERHIQNVFKLTGESDLRAKATAQEVFNFEKGLASASMSRVEQRDPNKIYNKLTAKQLQVLCPLFDWKEMLAHMAANADTVIVRQPNFMKQIDQALKTQKLDQWKNYLRWCVVKRALPYLSSPFVAEGFSFVKLLNGQKEMQPRWKRVMNAADNYIGEPLGSLYVDKYFKPEAKQRILEMVDNLTKVFQKRIQNLDWMTAETKKRALYKLSKFALKIGYPDKFKNYSIVQIDRNNYFGNVVAANKFLYYDNVNRLGKPADPSLWEMTPPTVNAYYEGVRNEIVFPAGILRFPFFDPNADDAVNYGGIGAVIGHEMTHGFDDEGRQYDADGNLTDWWTEDDAKKFDQKAAQVGAQYDKFTVLDTLHVNGKLTMGENLADFGGISIAYEAFKTYSNQGKSNNTIDGFTPDQRFFLSWGQIWRQNLRDESKAQRITIDPHSPGKYRCNGPLSNMPEFYKTFGVKPGDGMWRPEQERAKVW